MLWLKAFHIIFVVTWFAGLFYLPRLFVYHAEASEPALRSRLKTMERRLLAMSHVGGTLALGFGIALAWWWVRHAPGWFATSGWLHVKLLLVALLVVYHVQLIRMVRRFAADDIRHSSRWLRWFNEIPGVLLVAIVLLAVLKPI